MTKLLRNASTTSTPAGDVSVLMATCYLILGICYFAHGVRVQCVTDLTPVGGSCLPAEALA